jgi:hypothetical protein
MTSCPDLSQLDAATEHLAECEACRTLAAAARSIELPNAESSGCARVWPLLAVPDDQLGALDRRARDGHIAACARCRRIALDTWLDEEPKLVAQASLPTAVALSDPPARRKPRVRFALAAGSLAAAALGATAFGVVHFTHRPAVEVTSPSHVSTSHDLVSPPSVRAVLDRRKAGESPALLRDELRAVPSTQWDYPQALYWIAVLSLQDLDDSEAARAALGELAGIHTTIRWLGPWRLIREAQLAEHDGRTADARDLWAKAKAESYRDAEYKEFVEAAAVQYGLTNEVPPVPAGSDHGVVNAAAHNSTLRVVTDDGVWAYVNIAGQPEQEVPGAKFQLAAGRYTVRLRNTDLQVSFRCTVILKTGETKTLHVALADQRCYGD